MNRNATATRNSKRKAQGSPDQAPPLKRAVNGRPAVDDADYVEDGYEYEYDELEASEADLHPAMYIGTPGSLGEWQDTIQNVVRNVVAIRFCQTCSFDTEPALTSEASGFVVDAERG